MAEKITKAFLEKAVKEPITDFTVGAGAKKGDNVMGSLLAIKATGKSGKIYNLVYKYMMDDPAQKQYAVEYGIFRTEMAAYSVLVPRLQKLIEERSGTPYPALTPKLYDALSDGDNDYLLMEDVRPSGYIMPDKFLGLNFEETSLILKKLAEFHAASYFYIKQEGEKCFVEDEDMNKFVNNPYVRQDPEMEVTGRIMFTDCYDRGIALIKKTDEKLGEKISAAVPANETFNLMRSLSRNTDKKHFPCIVHGDFWTNNIMVKYENGDRTKPLDLKFIDFQMTRRSNIFEELTYFIMCSTTPEFRKNHYEQILRVYYESFTNFLEDTLKTNIPIGFTRGYFVNTMYELSLPGFVYMTFAIPMQLADPPDFPSMFGEAMMSLGLDMCPPPSEEKDGGKNEQAQGPPDFPMEVMVKIRNFMIYKQLEKSPRGTERLLSISRELVDLKLA